MTFKLDETELQNAFDAIEHHGYSTLLPKPLEWTAIQNNWPQIKTELCLLDLDTYNPHIPLRVYAPKNRATVRVVSLLHPVDLILYTALTILVKDDLEADRVSPSKKIVHSYRTEIGIKNRLYPANASFSAFQARLKQKHQRPSTKYVAIADIADFYPRIYQHRLENVIEVSARSERSKDVARVLVKKFISKISGKNSYGIPVGPYASRILAEAVLIDIDSHLISQGFDFVRWVDDYFFFTHSEQHGQEILIVLAERLYENHGLTLSASKTKIQSSEEFGRRFEIDPDRNVDDRIKKIKELSSRFDPYLEEEIELSDKERAELAEIDIAELISEALENRELVDYGTISALLKHPALLSILPAASRKKIGDLLLKNVEHLYPIAGEVAGFFGLLTDQSAKDRARTQVRLLSSIQRKQGKWPPDFYVMWILNLFAQSDIWQESPEFTRIYREHRSSLVRRSAALAISTNGTRADAVELKEHFSTASPLEQLAVLLASHRLGQDERKHWKTSLQLSGVLERVL